MFAFTVEPTALTGSALEANVREAAEQVVVMGVSSCGKSTIGELLAQVLGIPFVDADARHPQVNIIKMASGMPLTHEDRWAWLVSWPSSSSHRFEPTRQSSIRCGLACENVVMPSPQTLSEADRRRVAAWAADCAERVLVLFETEAPTNDRPRHAISRTRAFSRGELDTAGEIRRRFVAGRAAQSVSSPAAVAAARAAGQASGVAHMGAHALGAAAYAAKAIGLAASNQPAAVAEEISWQLEHMSTEVRAALRQLPALGEDSAGPLGPGLLASGVLGEVIRTIQAATGTIAPVKAPKPANG
jgi:hypothetical protein